MLHKFGIIPSPGMILMCDFDGYVAPEIIKRRHVIVISPKTQNQWGTCLVVPVSSVRPKQQSAVHVALDPTRYNCFDENREQWAKANLLAHVRTQRLDRVKNGGIWDTPQLHTDDYKKLQSAVHAALASKI